jgi:superfamily I DNA/RNA helicase
MAQFSSSHGLEAIETRSEREACERFLEGLPETMRVFHSVPHVTQTDHGARDGEIDLIVLDPNQGLLVLEVKGGKEVGYDQDRGWYSTSHDGQTHSIKDPFTQARRNLYSVRDRIRDAGIFSRHEELPFTYGYGCVFPHAVVQNGAMPMHVRPELCIDARGLQRAEDSIEALFGFWRGKKGREEKVDGWADVVADQVLAPSFRAEESLRVRIEREQAQFVELTEEQTEVYARILQANRQALVQGVAGTGKTILAQHRATELAESGEETLYLCFNRLLADHLAEDLSGVENLTVATFHELADVLSQRTRAVEFPEDPDQEFWDEGAADLLLQAIEATATRYDALVVDEAQDFRETWWLPVRELIDPEGYFYVFCDPEQNVYDTNLEPIEDLPTHVPLTTNCRTTTRIRKFAESLVDLGDITDAKHLADGEPVETYAFEEREEQVDILEDVVRRLKQDIGLSSSEIVLLSPFTREKSVLGNRLVGYHIEPINLKSPSEDTLYHSTILGYKGMDAPAVVVFDVMADHVASQDSHIYVGCSRAQNLLYLLHQKEWMR